ncbi:MAG: hypothetical protein QM773_18380 [Hyphomonadaceae bacterium]
MRLSIIALAALGLASGCDSKAPAEPEATTAGPTAATCIPPVKREVALTAPGARDVLEAQVMGADCEKASLVLNLHKADGTLLWTYSVRASDTWAFVPADDNKSVDPKAGMDKFLADVFQNARIETSDMAPDWPEGSAGPQDPTGLFHVSPMPREAYLNLRAKKLPVLCVQAEMGTSHCVSFDPEFGDTASDFYSSSS